MMPGGCAGTILSGLFAILLLGACSGGAPQPSQVAPGSDRDSHGCIPSAGYRWCGKTNQCERPWELAEQHAFENTEKGFDEFCAAPAGDE